MSTADDRRREDEAARENHRRLSPQELQDEHDRAVRHVASGKDNGYFEREEQRLRQEMGRRGIQPRTSPND